MLFFLKIMQMFVEEKKQMLTTNTWVHFMKEVHHCLRYLFLSIIVHMGHDQRDRLKD